MFEQELIDLAAAGGGAIVKAMAADAWTAAKSKVLGFFKGRKDQEVVEGELDASKELVAAEGVDSSVVQSEQQRWSNSLETILRDHPDAYSDLQALIGQLKTVVIGSTSSTQSVTAQRDAFVSARDQHISIDNRDSRR